MYWLRYPGYARRAVRSSSGLAPPSHPAGKQAPKRQQLDAMPTRKYPAMRAKLIKQVRGRRPFEPARPSALLSRARRARRMDGPYALARAATARHPCERPTPLHAHVATRRSRPTHAPARARPQGGGRRFFDSGDYAVLKEGRTPDDILAAPHDAARLEPRWKLAAAAAAAAGGGDASASAAPEPPRPRPAEPSRLSAESF